MLCQENNFLNAFNPVRTYMCEANNGIGATPLRKLIRLTVNGKKLRAYR